MHCEVYEAQDAKGKSLCKCGSIPPKLQAGMKETLKENKNRTQHQTAMHHFRKAQKKQLASRAERLVKDADYRECMQEDSRTYETMESWDPVAHIPQKTPT